MNTNLSMTPNLSNKKNRQHPIFEDKIPKNHAFSHIYRKKYKTNNVNIGKTIAHNNTKDT